MKCHLEHGKLESNLQECKKQKAKLLKEFDQAKYDQRKAFSARPTNVRRRSRITTIAKSVTQYLAMSDDLL
jgi:flagellar biosynthesis/type III secretory pathway chaperone